MSHGTSTDEQFMQQALELARHGPWRWPRPIRASAPIVVAARARLWAAARHTYEGSKHAEVLAHRRSRRQRTRRDPLSQPGALLAHRTHRALCRCGDRRRYRTRGLSPCAIPTLWSPDADSPSCARPASRCTKGCCEAEARKLNEAFAQVHPHRSCRLSP